MSQKNRILQLLATYCQALCTENDKIWKTFQHATILGKSPSKQTTNVEVKK